MSAASTASNHTEDVKKHITSSDEWGTSMFQLSALSAKVAQFNFVAHENVSNVGDKVGGKQLPPTNHWSLFLTINHTASVRIEVAPNDPGKPGMVILESKKYDMSTKITHHVSIPAPSGLVVADVVRLVIQKHRDDYVFAPVGEGCRFWLSTLAGDLAAAGLVRHADAATVQSALGKYWPHPTGTQPVERPMAKGQFPKSGDWCVVRGFRMASS